MSPKFQKAFAMLADLGVPVYKHPDDTDNFSIDAESSESDNWVNYYSMNPEWEFGVNPALIQALDAHEMYAEWVNAGRLSVYSI
jgi:hypothetical protein